MESALILLEGKIKSLISSEGLDFYNKEECVRSLSECVSKNKCIEIYINCLNKSKTEQG